MKNLVYSCVAGILFALCGCSVVQNNDSEYQEYISLLKASKNPEELKNSSLMHWESSSEYKIIYADKNIVSFRCESYSYTGGAHGMPDTKVGTIKNGKLLQLADLPDLNKIKILWQQALKSHSQFSEIKKYTGFIGTKPQLTENFYLDGKGIHFIYQPYEIAPFAAGTIEIFVPLSFDSRI